MPQGWTFGDPLMLVSTLGRILFNEALPSDYPFVNEKVDKKVLGATVNRLSEMYPKIEVAETLDSSHSVSTGRRVPASPSRFPM